MPEIRNRLLLCFATPGRGLSARLAELLVREANEAVARIGGGDVVYRVLQAVPASHGTATPTEYDGVLERGLSNGVHLGGFEAVLEVTTPESTSLDELAASVAGIAKRLEGEIIADQSFAIVGTDFIVLDGGGPFQLVYCMPRSSTMSHTEFCRFWADEHTKVSVFTPGLAGYRQLHTSLEHSLAAASAAGLRAREVDGVALEWFASVDEFVGAVGAPAEFRDSAKASEEQFNDISGVTAILTSVIDNGQRTGGGAW